MLAVKKLLTLTFRFKAEKPKALLRKWYLKYERARQLAIITQSDVSAFFYKI
jgi:hypothetical protein